MHPKHAPLLSFTTPARPHVTRRQSVDADDATFWAQHVPRGRPKGGGLRRCGFVELATPSTRAVPFLRTHLRPCIVCQFCPTTPGARKRPAASPFNCYISCHQHRNLHSAPATAADCGQHGQGSARLQTHLAWFLGYDQRRHDHRRGGVTRTAEPHQPAAARQGACRDAHLGHHLGLRGERFWNQAMDRCRALVSEPCHEQLPHLPSACPSS